MHCPGGRVPHRGFAASLGARGLPGAEVRRARMAAPGLRAPSSGGASPGPLLCAHRIPRRLAAGRLR
eukprot:331857-Alexandrium_andersonii.AAC.1